MILVLLPVVHATFWETLWQFLNNQDTFVGQAYATLVRCGRYETLAAVADSDLEKCRQSNTICNKESARLEQYQGYLDSYCRPVSCAGGDLRCSQSNTGKTHWVEVCKDDEWTSQAVCHSGCEKGSCVPGNLLFTIKSDPEDVALGQSSLVIVDITNLAGQPIEGVEVQLGSDSGVYLNHESVSDEYGQVLSPWVGSDHGYVMLSASAEIDGVYHSDKTYVLVT